MWSELRRQRGAILVLVIAVATVWLASTGRLALYIHPRYDVFTVVMALIAIAFCVASIGGAVLRSRRPTAHGHHDHVEHDHVEHDHDDAPTTRPGRVLGALGLGLSAALAVGIVVLPPATLSSATAIQRDITADASVIDQAAGAEALAAAEGASTETFAAFTVRDWAMLLRQTDDPGFYAGKPVDIVGFVTEHPDDPGLFYVSRFVISCCAVDAQPYGVPVALAGWSDELDADQWVRVTGEFGFAAGSGGPAIVLDPAEVTVVDEPSEPYLF